MKDQKKKMFASQMKLNLGLMRETEANAQKENISMNKTISIVGRTNGRGKNFEKT